MMSEYIRLLLPRWLRPEDGSDLAKFVDAWSDAIEAARNAVGEIRRQGITGTAAGQALDRIGESRNVVRWDEETDEEYRKRLLATFATRMRAATPAGMLALMASLGHPEAEITEFGLLSPALYFDGTWSFNGASNYLYDGKSRWAVFAITLDVGPDVEPLTVRRWIAQVKWVKPAHTKLAYLSLRHPLSDVGATETSETLTITSSHQARYNGAFEFDGTVTFGPTVEVFYA